MVVKAGVDLPTSQMLETERSQLDAFTLNLPPDDTKTFRAPVDVLELNFEPGCWLGALGAIDLDWVDVSGVKVSERWIFRGSVLPGASSPVERFDHVVQVSPKD